MVNFFSRKILLSLFIFIAVFFNPNFSFSKQENLKSDANIIQNYKSKYILGKGDILRIIFTGLDLFNGNYPIQNDGYIQLPDIGRIYSEGKTLDEFKDILLKKYANYIYKPDITVIIQKKRPLRVTLRGEVNKTGLFVLKPEDMFNDEDQSTLTAKSILNQRSIIQPRITELIKKGEGITSYADLSNIIVIRNNPKNQGGGKITTTIDLLKLLKEGDQTQDIELFDGDDILVTKSNKILLDQLIEINKSNLTPDQIEIFINGNVNQTGRIIARQGISLLEAIASVGGTKANTGNIEFIRLSRNGRTQKRIINYDKRAAKGSDLNPILTTGDIVFVRKNIFGKTTNFITDYTAPFVNAYGIYKIFD
jgi:polysaccharide export outer membrane protein